MSLLVENVAKAMAKADSNNDFWKQYIQEARAAIRTVQRHLEDADEGVHFASMDLLKAELRDEATAVSSQQGKTP
jgi:hypothetical protein